MITLAHISDIHLSPLPAVAFGDLLGKRLTGFLNWKLKRHGELNSETLLRLVGHMQAQKADFTAVTGDLTNLALRAEVTRAGRWLEALGDSERIAVCPGNHDAYVPGALELAQELWGPYLRGETLEGQAFPFVRRIGELAIVSCSSAVPTPPFFAIGRFDDRQPASPACSSCWAMPAISAWCSSTIRPMPNCSTPPSASRATACSARSSPMKGPS